MTHNRPTTTLDLPQSAGKVIIYDWLTGGEVEQIQSSMKDVIGINVKGKEAEINFDRIDLETAQAFNKVLVEKYVVSVNDKSENIVADLKDLPNDDYNFVLQKVIALWGKKKET